MNVNRVLKTGVHQYLVWH